MWLYLSLLVLLVIIFSSSMRKVRSTRIRKEKHYLSLERHFFEWFHHFRLNYASNHPKWDSKRTYQMSLSFGLTSGFLCHYWYNFLDRVYPGKGLKVVCKKIVVDQVIFSPICIVSCLLVACAINRHSLERTYKEVKVKGNFRFFKNQVNHCLLCLTFQVLSYLLQSACYGHQLNLWTSISYQRDIECFMTILSPCCMMCTLRMCNMNPAVIKIYM